jgi:hypothetical protein
MEMSLRVKDPFRERIWEILLSESTGKTRGGFKSRVFTEVQNYSRELQEAEHDSDFFFRLLELIVDCRSLSIPDESFKITVASLLFESENSKVPLDEEIRELIGMDPASYEMAKEASESRQCIVTSLNKERSGRKSNVMAGKRNIPHQIEASSGLVNSE